MMPHGTGAHDRCSEDRERGTLLIVSALLLVMRMALATSFFMVVQKNVVQARFYGDLSELRRYAASGVNLAIHELSQDVAGGDGDLGTEVWTAANDTGRDGT